MIQNYAPIKLTEFEKRRRLLFAMKNINYDFQIAGFADESSITMKWNIPS